MAKGTKLQRTGGAPTKFDDTAAAVALAMLTEGATVPEVCETLEITRATFYNWMKRIEGFSNAVKNARAQASARVEQTLLARATGYDYTEQQAIKVKVGPHEEEVQIVTVRKHLPPETLAMIFWLKNRAKEDWADVSKTLTETTDNSDPTKLAHAILNVLADARRQSDGQARKDASDSGERGVLLDQRDPKAG